MNASVLVDVSSILGEPGATLEVDEEVPLSSMCVSDVEAHFTAPPQMRAVLANAGDVLLLTGSVSATAILECSRCLEPFECALVGTLDAVISPSDQPELRDEDQEWYPLIDESVDLLPAAQSALRVEVPFAPVHSAECHGICPTCGCNLNEDTCACQHDSTSSADSPFAALKDLLPPDAE
ncbi:MAG: DUF177 domain-containing protein [Coriobacteriia bacterium]|jgi:uncharacterized protein|nr:DUF177 domain-containing protein [Coriobacteriia bacterium]